MRCWYVDSDLLLTGSKGSSNISLPCKSASMWDRDISTFITVWSDISCWGTLSGWGVGEGGTLGAGEALHPLDMGRTWRLTENFTGVTLNAEGLVGFFCGLDRGVDRRERWGRERWGRKGRHWCNVMCAVMRVICKQDQNKVSTLILTCWQVRCPAALAVARSWSWMMQSYDTWTNQLLTVMVG